MGIFNKRDKISGETLDILDQLDEFIEELSKKSGGFSRAPVSKQQFILLLSGIFSCRRIPGIDGHMGYQSLYFCPGVRQAEKVRDYLRRTYRIADKASLLETFRQLYSNGEEFGQFLSFWEGNPAFDEDELTPDGRLAFKRCQRFAEHFRDFVGDKGFLGWDINERVGLCRAAYACGILKEEEFFDICEPLARQAAETFDSWEEYALSCLCGSVYSTFVLNGMEDQGIYESFDSNLKLARRLFFEDRDWADCGWYQFGGKKWAIPSEQLKNLLDGWSEPAGCLATDRILVDGCRVGYMYREEPDGHFQDSGWRFFAGDESNEYTANPDRIGIYHLNTVCNYDPDIIGFLNAPVGSAYFRDGRGRLVQETFAPHDS